MGVLHVGQDLEISTSFPNELTTMQNTVNVDSALCLFWVITMALLQYQGNVFDRNGLFRLVLLVVLEQGSLPSSPLSSDWQSRLVRLRLMVWTRRKWACMTSDATSPSFLRYISYKYSHLSDSAHVNVLQDPVLFGGTVKYNLDPFNQYTDNQLWTVLEQVSNSDKEMMTHPSQLRVYVNCLC